jgi:hypothetical protein
MGCPRPSAGRRGLHLAQRTVAGGAAEKQRAEFQANEKGPRREQWSGTLSPHPSSARARRVFECLCVVRAAWVVVRWWVACSANHPVEWTAGGPISPDATPTRAAACPFLRRYPSSPGRPHTTRITRRGKEDRERGDRHDLDVSVPWVGVFGRPPEEEERQRRGAGKRHTHS